MSTHPARTVGCLPYHQRQGVQMMSLPSLCIPQTPVALVCLSSIHPLGYQSSIPPQNPRVHLHMKRLRLICLHLYKFYLCPLNGIWRSIYHRCHAHMNTKLIAEKEIFEERQGQGSRKGLLGDICFDDDFK